MSSLFFDKIIERGILFLLIFTPLAQGAVHDWSIAVMELVSFGIFFAWVLRSLVSTAEIERKGWQAASEPLRKMLLSAGLLACIALLQLVPLPLSLLGLISPKTLALYQKLGNVSDGTWGTISVYPHATVNELLRISSYVAVFVVVIGHYRTEEKIKSLFRTVIAMGVFLAVLAVIQKLFGNGKLLWVMNLEPGWNYFGPYINRNHFAGYMEMAAPIGLGYYLYTASLLKGRRSGVSRLRQLLSIIDNTKLPTVSTTLAGVLVMTCGLFMTLSRGGIIGFAVSMTVFVALARSRRSLMKRKAFLSLAGSIIALTVVAAGWSMLEARFEKSRSDGTTRFNIWQDSFQVIMDYPLLGSGLGTFNHIYPAYQTRYPHLAFEHPENEYIEIVTDSGLIGLTGVLGLLLVFFSSVTRQWRERHNPFVVSMAPAGIASCTAMVVHGMTDFNMRIPANAMLVAVIAAATFAAVFNVESRGSREREVRGAERKKILI